MAAHINSDRWDVVGAAVHEILHFIGLEDGYNESPLSSHGSREMLNRDDYFKPGYGPDQIMAVTDGTLVKEFETQGLRAAFNGMRSGAEWRTVQSRLDAMKQAGKIR